MSSEVSIGQRARRDPDADRARRSVRPQVLDGVGRPGVHADDREQARGRRRRRSEDVPVVGVDARRGHDDDLDAAIAGGGQEVGRRGVQGLLDALRGMDETERPHVHMAVDDARPGRRGRHRAAR